jgi:hypothetical protein
MVRLKRRTRLAAIRLAAALLAGSLALACHAQATKTATDHIDSRVDVYGGYGYLHPINSGIAGFQYQDVSNPNATASISAYFNKYIGIQMEGSYFSGEGEHAIYNSPAYNCSKENCDQLVYTAEAGPVFRLPLGPFVPFVHLLGGGERTNGPVAQSLFWGWGVTGGAGIDIVLPFDHHRFAIRPIQADFQYSQVVYGPLVLPASVQGGFGEIDALKLSGGIVARFGDARGPGPVMLGCVANPVAVFPGDPVKITGSTLNLDPRRKVAYTWTAKGGKVTPEGPGADLDTTGLAPGEYVVVGHVAQGSHASEQASCEAPFTVRKYDPPTITCAATPSTAESGTEIAISTSGSSPQNRPLMYSYTTTAGEITSNGPTAKLSTAGLSPSTITITCNTVDDLGQSASATTQVTLTAPPTPVVVQTQQLCSLGFLRDKRRPTRVDNEAKGCLDDIALTLNKESDAKLVIIGNYAPTEKEDAAAERTLNARQYLTKEKGVDPSRIEVRLGGTPGKTVTDVLVPAGAIYNDVDTRSFDEKTITRHGQAYGIARPKTAAGTHPAIHQSHPPAAKVTDTKDKPAKKKTTANKKSTEKKTPADFNQVH